MTRFAGFCFVVFALFAQGVAAQEWRPITDVSTLMKMNVLTNDLYKRLFVESEDNSTLDYAVGDVAIEVTRHEKEETAFFFDFIGNINLNGNRLIVLRDPQTADETALENNRKAFVSNFIRLALCYSDSLEDLRERLDLDEEEVQKKSFIDNFFGTHLFKSGL